ncbi:GNAT family N-acetyltransferase [Halobacteria archaeon AArc-m2/3/4]|uniref:GNAT family N-acetyltransferase n=1 Tax=Natronoglomus mannanivorans TaxID=2979990 RepID=A0ABT2Q9F5_9EURY|nr:GNAT family N-acetyltransferase [Halobacteria archaeon AArc-m2/3/4]
MTTTDTDLRIEFATETDLETLADDWIALAREQEELGSHIVPDANREAIRDVLAAHQFNDGLLVARIPADETAGFASFSIERGMFTLDSTRGVLSNLYVKPPYRDRGIGTALLKEVEHTLTERGATVVILEAMAANEAARRFYRRHGYDTYRVAMERSLEGEESDSQAETGSGKNDTHSKEDR